MSYTVTWTGSMWAGYLTACAGLVIGARARRWSLLRYPALGWLTGVVVTVALITAQLLG